MSKAIALSIAEAPRERERCDDARRRARLERVAPAARAASSALITPPEDCMIVSGAPIPQRVEPAPDVADVAAHQRPDVGVDDRRRGCARTPAARGGSRSRARRACRAAPRAGSRRRAARARGARWAWSRQTATDSTPASRSRAASARDLVRVERRAARRRPALMRSATSKRSRRGTSGGGFVQNGSYRCGMRIRRSSSTSRKPAVVTSAVRAPRRSSTALVATVVPWTTALDRVRLAPCHEDRDGLDDRAVVVGRRREHLA